MKVIVIGAGVVGMATAYYLVRHGVDVVVVDEQSNAGEGTSKGNGAQLCYNYVAPLAGPGVIGKLPTWLTDRDSPVRFSPTLDVHQWLWCLEFLRRCNRRDSERTTQSLLKLSHLSSNLMAEFSSEVPINFDYTTEGKLVVYSNLNSFESAKQQAQLQKTHGSNQFVIGPRECLDMEPTLGPIGKKLVGGIFTPDDHTADAHLFCRELNDYLSEAHASYQFASGHKVNSIITHGNKATGIRTNNGDMYADAVIVATGITTNPLLRTVGLRVPIYPIRGYSITLSIQDKAKLPRISVTDYDERIVYAPIGARLRVAGIADIGGYAKQIDLRRIAVLEAQARQVYPVSKHENLSPWCGLRPATPAGLPIYGQSSIEGLFLNVGHGALGWTLALATGHIVASDVLSILPRNP
ncbi:D-amino acid dehydrogenase [Herbaspirillum sp. GCM10030257]|uniref:D-amino acid dehydrogenase n=1 Tax=Herbaspirillum sp. GCM10030257 TaxID=3273393 RepID=UPI00360EF7E6